MSWSFSAIGLPEKIAEALEAESAKLTGQSKVEFDGAMPCIITLLRQNFAKEGNGYLRPILRLDAIGSSATLDGEQVQRSCRIVIEPMFTRLLV